MSCERCVLTGRGLCDKLITRPEQSYRLWCVVVCDLENLVNEEALTHWGLLQKKWLEKSAVQLDFKLSPCSVCCMFSSG